VARLVPGRQSLVRLIITNLELKDSVAAQRRLRRASVALVRFGDAESAENRDSIVVSGPRDQIDTIGGEWYRDIPLGRLPASDSTFILIQDGDRKYGPFRAWRRASQILPVPVVYGNLRMPSDSMERWILKHLHDPEKFIQKIPTSADDYRLTPQGRGDLPPRRLMAIGLEFPELSGFVEWAPSIQVAKIVYRGSATADTLLAASPAFLPARCRGSSASDSNGTSVCTTYAYLGEVPVADSVEIVLKFREEARKLRIWSERSSQFLVALALGTTFPLNKLSPNDTLARIQPRLGFNGRVILTEIDPALSKVGRLHLFNSDLFRGPIIAEGELYLGLSTLQEGVADTNRYEQATEGSLRVSVPILDFGRSVALRGQYEVGSVSIRDSDKLQSEHYFGFRLGLEPADISGRQSYIELAWGKSNNLTPESRRRLTAQFRIPTTNIVLQFRNNFARGRNTGGPFENTSILSAYVPLEASEVLRILGLRGVKSDGHASPEAANP